MTIRTALRVITILTLCAGVAACGGRRAGGGGIFGPVSAGTPSGDLGEGLGREAAPTNYARSSIWDVFGPNRAEQTVNVNRYLWAASLDVLNFLPVQSVDPFTGVITTGYGRPPGGGRAYRATILISDPALDARSLNVALQTQSGPVSAGTQRAVEDAILARARQLRVQAGKY